jgi:hypothetical protein
MLFAILYHIMCLEHPFRISYPYPSGSIYKIGYEYLKTDSRLVSTRKVSYMFMPPQIFLVAQLICLVSVTRKKK